jgi:hypothetical protein
MEWRSESVKKLRFRLEIIFLSIFTLGCVNSFQDKTDVGWASSESRKWRPKNN